MTFRTVRLSVGCLTLLLASPQLAQAEPSSYSSSSGDTIFPASVSKMCLGKRTIHYRTRYKNISYQGTLFVDDDNCNATGRGLMVRGYFEERSHDGLEQCVGRLSVFTKQYPDGRNYAKWDNIAANPGYVCSGAGTQPTVNLKRN